MSRLLASGLLALLLVAPTATAHAALLSSEPPAGSRLEQAPSEVSVTLTEPADPSGTFLRVYSGSSQQATGGTFADCSPRAAASREGLVDRGDLRITPGNQPTLTVSLQSGLTNGTYVIAWQALSGADGHTTSGLIGFAVGNATPPASSSSSTATGACSIMGRVLGYSGLALAFGALVLLTRVQPAGSAAYARLGRKALLLGAGLHSVGVLVLLHATASSSGLDYTELPGSDVGAILLQRLAASLLAFALAVVALRKASLQWPPIVAGIILAFAAINSARLGHASLQGIPGIVVDYLHLIASLTWAGGLVLLLVILARGHREGVSSDTLRTAGLRFGTVALACVILLFLSGVVTTVLILGLDGMIPPWRMLDHGYGRVLLGKIVLAGLMVLLAGANRYVFLSDKPPKGLRARLASWGPDGTARGLRRSVTAEASLGGIIVVLAAILTAISPPASQELVELSAAGQEFHMELAIDPAPRAGGTSQLSLRIMDHSRGGSVEDNTCGRDDCVDIRIGPDASSGERHVFTPTDDGTWQAEVLWTFSGPAVGVLRVQTADVFEDSAQVSFVIA